MVKYATALRLGTAEAEAILRRFTRENVQHPTYKALAELGKAVRLLLGSGVVVRARHKISEATIKCISLILLINQWKTNAVIL
jgi:hypothetical protein